MLLRKPVHMRSLPGIAFSFSHAPGAVCSTYNSFRSPFRCAKAIHDYLGFSHIRGYGSSSSSSPTVSSHLISAQHSSLQTFLTYARNTSLTPTSTTYLGTRYEYLTLQHLNTNLNFSLARVGGRGDSGIDLLGTWALPAVLRRQEQSLDSTAEGADNSVRVLVQCKRLTRVTGPALIRELEGSFRGAPNGWRGEDTLGVMVCTKAATKGIRDAMGRSTRGLVWILLEEEEEVKKGRAKGTSVDKTHKGADEDNDERYANSSRMPSEKAYTIPQTCIRQFLYNASAASKCGLEGVNVGLKYDELGNKGEAQLLWQGKPIDFSVK